LALLGDQLGLVLARKALNHLSHIPSPIYYCILKTPVETIPGMGGIKENDGGCVFKYGIFDIL
jgi:hypothetical protein